MHKANLPHNEVVLIGWLIATSKVFAFISALSTKAPPLTEHFYTIIHSVDTILFLILAAATLHKHWYRTDLIRMGLIFGIVGIHFVEVTLTQPLQGGLLDWAILVIGLGCIFLYDPTTELAKILVILAVGTFLNLGALYLNPYLSYIPSDAFLETTHRHAVIILAGAAGSAVLILRLRGLLLRIIRAADTERALTAQKEELLSSLTQEREGLIRALADVERLNTEEQRRAQREATLAQYEALMRESYTASVSDFLQKLLDRFAEELPMLGGVIYMRCAEGWRVESAYALRQYLGQTYPGGTLTTAANIKAPYLISPAPAGTAKIRTSVATLTPKAILYLPFYSEATGETLAVAELLLSTPISEEREALLKIVLPRIGTYLWARQTLAN